VEGAIRDGAVLHAWPKAMTMAVILAGLLPILWGGRAGSEVISRTAAPMIGGIVSAPLLSMFVVPAAWLLMRKRVGAYGTAAHPARDAGMRSKSWPAMFPTVRSMPLEGA
jgi:copper/silver efflux system protein